MENSIEVSMTESERTFIHDLSTPLSVMHLTLDALMEEVIVGSVLNSGQLESLHVTQRVLAQVTRMLAERRAQLKSLESR